MDQIFLSLKKRIVIPVVLLAGFCIWLFLCKAFYESYWQGTVHRVQTVDFNLLHHILPCTLSQLIVAGQDEQIQKVLDCTYGLFGLVVTDSSGKSILYRTNKIYRRESWQERATPEDLQYETEPFDYLTDPPPFEAMYEHKSPRSLKATRLATNPTGRILGRIYYVRAFPPSFVDDINSFLFTGFWELSGSKRGYLFITLASIGLSLVVILLIWLRQRGIELKQSEVEHMQRELDIRKKALEHLSAELTAQKARKVWLEKEADQSYKRALGLKQALEKLRDSLAFVNNSQQAALPQAGSGHMRVKSPMTPPSALLEEIEQLIPALSENATALKSQAGLLSDYCTTLEQRQQEMKRIVETAYVKGQDNLLDMRPGV